MYYTLWFRLVCARCIWLVVFVISVVGNVRLSFPVTITQWQLNKYSLLSHLCPFVPIYRNNHQPTKKSVYPKVIANWDVIRIDYRLHYKIFCNWQLMLVYILSRLLHYFFRFCTKLQSSGYLSNDDLATNLCVHLISFLNQICELL